MNISFELYRVFYIVAKVKSISSAAKELYISQPAVSRSIKQLEEKLSKQLFFRTPRGMQLTHEGELLFKYIEQAYNLISIAENKFIELQHTVDGEVRVGVSTTVFSSYLLPFIKVFHDNYPNVKINIKNKSTYEIVDILKNNEVDFGIVDLPIDESDEFNIREMWTVQDCFICNEKYKFLLDKPISIKELENYPILLREKNRNTRIYIDKVFEHYGVHIEPELEMTGHHAMIEFVKMGFGIGCVVRNFIEDELKKSILYELKTIEEIPSRKLGIITLKGAHLSTAAMKFIDYLQSYN